MKIINFKRICQPTYKHETTLHFLPRYYFWAQLGHASSKDMLQFWVSLWLDPKVYTCSKIINSQIGETVKTVEIDTQDFFNESKQVITAFYRMYGNLPEYLIIGVEKSQKLNYHAAFKYDLRSQTRIHGIKVLVLPTIEGIVALPDLKNIDFQHQ